MKGSRITPQEFDGKLHHEVGLLIKLHRQRAGLTQQLLSEEMGTSRAHIANMETGRYTINLQTILDLATIFECKPVELLPLDWQWDREASA